MKFVIHRLCLMIVILLIVTVGACAAVSDTAYIGQLPIHSVSAEALTEFVNAARHTHWTFVEFDNMQSMLLSLKTGKIDLISNLPDVVANYVIANNEGFQIADIMYDTKISLCLGVRSEETELLRTLNDAIAGMREDGWIEAALAMEPEAASIPYAEGEEPLRVVVTGDLPPLDTVTTDGQPAGFNVAFIAELARRTGRQVEIVTSDAASRMAMLASGRADVLFWTTTVLSDAIGTITEETEALALTDAYYVSDIYRLKAAVE